jgi:hypothetical protein
MAEDDDGLGKGFWWRMMGILFLIGIGAFLAFVFISGAFFRFGIIGGLIVVCVVLLGLSWMYDRRQAKKDAEYGDL